jgi:16S rRNA (guanine1207-N2)-methyltransferase
LEFNVKGVDMTEHYYTNKPSVESNPIEWSFSLRGKSFNFTSDSGVFSKKEVDFGSRLLIENFVAPDLHGDFLDLGCGYGPIGISLAYRYSEHHVVMVDVNERALELARKNARRNNVSNVTVQRSNLFDGLKNLGFSCILSNPPIRAGKKVVHQLLEQAYDYLIEGGELWIVIQKKQGAPSAIEKLETIFGEVEVVVKKKGYYIIRSKKV